MYICNATYNQPFWWFYAQNSSKSYGASRGFCATTELLVIYKLRPADVLLRLRTGFTELPFSYVVPVVKNLLSNRVRSNCC